MSSPKASKRYFVIAGAQRSGTTYLYRLLDQHSDIEMARPIWPEPKFFLDAERTARGLGAYEELFGHKPEANVRGEKATTYIESEDAARRIAEVLPDAKMIVLVRDPVARAISNYRFSVDHDVEALPLAEALTEDAQRRPYDSTRMSTSPFAYLNRGRYADYIDVYLRHFNRDSIKVVVLEELVADPKVLDEVTKVLGVHAFAPDEQGMPVNKSKSVVDEVTPDHERQLRDFFAPSVSRLEDFLGRPISAWRGA